MAQLILRFSSGDVNQINFKLSSTAQDLLNFVMDKFSASKSTRLIYNSSILNQFLSKKFDLIRLKDFGISDNSEIIVLNHNAKNKIS